LFQALGQSFQTLGQLLHALDQLLYALGQWLQAPILNLQDSLTHNSAELQALGQLFQTKQRKATSLPSDGKVAGNLLFIVTQ
jgi:chromosome condensin MukBEF complex kleisin-like MukF subunit